MHLPGSPEVTSPLDSTGQRNRAVPDAPVPSVAVTVTWLSLRAVGIPRMTPAELIRRPAGRPLAVNFRRWPGLESDALIVSGAILVPLRLAWLPRPVGPSYPARAVHR